MLLYCKISRISGIIGEGVVFLAMIRKHKKIRQVAALKYDAKRNLAPEIVAKGKGIIADKIIEKAKESDVPIYYNENLAETLNAMKIGEEIPPRLYEVVAEILVFVSDLDKKYGERYGVHRKE